MKTFGLTVLRRAAVGASLLLLPAMAQGQSWFAVMNGGNEVPPNGSAAAGYASMTLAGTNLFFSVVFANLTTPASAAHIHCCGAAGTVQPVVVAFGGFPNSLSSSYSNTFDLSLTTTFSAAFVAANGATAAGARGALIAAFNSGNAYTNIHNATFGGGEIRGQVQVAPEPSSVALMLAGLLAVGAVARRKKKARVV